MNPKTGTSSARRARADATRAAATFRVVIADPISATGLDPLRREPRLEVLERTGLKGEDFARALEDADAVIVRSMSQVTRESLRYADRLRVIGRAGVGVDNIDVDAATERGIAVLNAPSGNTVSAAELTMALLLTLVRRVTWADQSMKRGEWDRKTFQGAELKGKTLGLVGAGRIGAEVARRAQAFGMRVVASDPFLPEDRARTLEIELVPLEDLLRRADVLSLHVPLTHATAGMIGEAELRLLKKGALVVNAARGGVLDEIALVRALEEGRVAGAALDVYEQEPLPEDHPLRSAPNTVLMPHLGAATREAQENVAVEIAQAVRDALIEDDLSQAVNAPAIGSKEMRRLRPLLDLAERLGVLLCALHDGPITELEVRYTGPAEDALRPLASAGLTGVLSSVLGRGAVNIVNAAHLAEVRGIQVRRVWNGSEGDYAECVELAARGEGGGNDVAGALIGAGHPRVVRIGSYHVDVRPSGALVVLRNRDVPGVIGRVGSLLGEARINIGEYHQSRNEEGGEALAAISVDDRLAPELVESLRRIPDVLEVRQVVL